MLPPSHPPPTVLLIDDDEAFTWICSEMMSAHGFTVIAGGSGVAALQHLPAHPPDLVLLDVTMPGVDGFETCRRLKALPAYRDVPIFFLSGLASASEKLRGFQAGAVDYITKPVETNELLARVRVHLKLSAQRHALNAILDARCMMVNRSGQVFFSGGIASRLMERYCHDFEGAILPPAILTWLFDDDHSSRPFVLKQDGKGSEVWAASMVTDGEYRVLRLQEKIPEPAASSLISLGLTPREADTLFWVSKGKTSPEIAIILGLGADTVKKHVHRILTKLNVETRMAAGLKAISILVPPVYSPFGIHYSG